MLRPNTEHVEKSTTGHFLQLLYFVAKEVEQEVVNEYGLLLMP